MKKDIRQNITLDEETKAILTEIARRNTEGNESMAIRKMIRKQAVVFGIKIKKQPPQKEATK